MTMQVAALGISSNTCRYAHRAVERLLASGDKVFGFKSVLRAGHLQPGCGEPSTLAAKG
jgi:hypothetical protein